MRRKIQGRARYFFLPYGRRSFSFVHSVLPISKHGRTEVRETLCFLFSDMPSFCPPLFPFASPTCYIPLVDLPELLRTVLPYLRPSEQAVYLRLWHLAGGQGTCSVRYEDLGKSAHVSTSTLKRALKSLVYKKLLTITFQAKQATRFQVWERPLTPKGQPTFGFSQPKLYDFFTPEDRSLFLSCKRALSPSTLQSLDNEAGGDPYQLDLLIMHQVFGPDRQRKYAHLAQAPRPN